MWISSVASMLIWRKVVGMGGTGTASTGDSGSSNSVLDPLPSALAFMFVLSDEPSDSIFLRKYVIGGLQTYSVQKNNSAY